MPHSKKNVNGEEIIEYYHRYVFCQLVLSPVPVVLDLEPLLPGEGETTAAERMLRRMLREQPRMVDVFTFDALYAAAGFLRLLSDAGKWWVVVLKQENRDAYKEIDALLPLTPPVLLRGGDDSITLWDIRDIDAWDAMGKKFRAVVSEEKNWRVKRNARRKKEKFLETSHWRWLTNLPEVYSAATVHRIGHARWEIENRGFNDLAQNCRLDHPFRHHPNALAAMLWIICLAFTLSYAFFLGNLKPQLRARIQTRQQLALEFLASLSHSMPPLNLIRLNDDS